MSYAKYVIKLVCLLFSLASCTNKNLGKQEYSDENVRLNVSLDSISSFSLDPTTVGNYNRFAYNFLADALKKNEGPNIVVSPISAEFLLSLLANGADNVASNEILNYLNFNSLQDLNEMNRMWLWLTHNTEDFTAFSLANSIWFSESLKLNKHYKRKVANGYNCSFYKLNRDPIKSQEQINQWASENTEGLISNFLITPLPSTIPFAIFNTAYFKGEWRQDFWESETSYSPFYTPNGTVSVETMRHLIRGGRLYVGDKYKGADIFYSYKQFTMRIFVPKDDSTIAEVIESLAKGCPKPLNKAFDVYIPKFECRTRLENLNEIFRHNGVNQIFSQQNLKSISSYPKLLEHSQLMQETVINIDEKGTKVATVSGDGIAFESGEKFETIDFIVDRPFIFAIIEYKTGAVMFAGVINDPSKK